MGQRTPLGESARIGTGAAPNRRSEDLIILYVPSITAEQIVDSLLAIPAFIPPMVCTGYMAAWLTNLHGFRERSLVERFFWSVPLSLAVSTIASVLIGKYLSLDAVVMLLLACAVLCLVTLAMEWLRLHRARQKWIIGWRPFGSTALILAMIWTAVAVLSLVDLQHGHKLFMSVTVLDQGARVGWTESVLRTGVPPTNPLYQFEHPAAMRNYYFWYVVCAAVTRIARLPARPVFIASSVWAGFVLAALTGLYLKHFLAAGIRLRSQFICSILLFAVMGLDFCVALWDIFYLQQLPPVELNLWSKNPMFSWLSTLLWAPNHIASLACCMLALLLVCMASMNGARRRTANVFLVALALASAFGLSLFVTFAFFLVMVVWSLWQLIIEKAPRPGFLMAAGGAGAAVLLIPYLTELVRSPSGVHGPRVFEFAVRESISPNVLLASHVLQHATVAHPWATVNLVNLALLAPGYTLQLGFFLVVLLIYVVPAWRGRLPLNPGQRSLVFVAVTTLPIVSLIRSGVLQTNDFGWRGALLLQFPLLLLASEVIISMSLTEHKPIGSAEFAGLPRSIPQWLRSIAAVSLVLGVFGILFQGLMLRFITSLAEWHKGEAFEPRSRSIAHNAYISSIGYAQLDMIIQHNAVVQFNPIRPEPFWSATDLLGIDHQAAIISDQPSCGAELGGNPSGCAEMAAAIDILFNGATAEQARRTCHNYGIQILVARIYDPPWKDKSSWVWTLKSVVSNDEFRALDCRQ